MIKKQWKSKLENIVTVLCILIIGMSVVAFGAIKGENAKKETFQYQEHLGDTVFSIEKEEVSLKEIGYYILVMETNYSQAANAYDEENEQHFWNLWTGKAYTREMAKKEVLNACIRDEIYYHEALKEKMSLTEEEQAEIRAAAISEINKLNVSQRALFGYELSDFITIQTKIAYARKFVTEQMEEGMTREELDTDGEVYKKIEEEYEISVNDSLWNQVKIGTSTTDGAVEQ